MKSLRTTLFYISMIIVGITAFTSCSDDNKPDTSLNTLNDYKYKAPKYVFFFIGDGMASSQINVTEQIYGQLSMKNDFKVSGMATTYALNQYITESAAAATALATGKKTNVDIISMNPEKTVPYKTMAEMAKEKGMKVGIISSVSIDHATPACFYAHEPSRKNMYNISTQMASSNFDFFGGGYALGNQDPKNAKDIEGKMQAAGYKLAKSKGELNGLSKGAKAWAYTTVDAEAALNYEIDRKSDEISLAEFTKKGIEVLDNEKGFFMMVEGGKIDWANHANDCVAQSKDVVAFDDAIKVAVDFYNKHPEETLIIITGDHECGGLSIGYAATGYGNSFEILKNQNISYQFFSEKVSNWKKNNPNMTFTEAMEIVKQDFGLGNETVSTKLKLTSMDSTRLKEAFNYSMTGKSSQSKEEINLNYGGYDAFTVTITHILNNKAGIGWTSYSHTGVPVPVFAKGQGELLFSGYYDNTDVAKKIISIAKLGSVN